MNNKLLFFSTLTADARFSCMVGSTDIVEHKRTRLFPLHSESYYIAENDFFSFHTIQMKKIYFEVEPHATSQNQIESSLYPRYFAEACNEWRRPSPLLSAWVTQLRRNVATVASRWRHCADLTGPGIEPHTSRTDSVRLTTELTGDNILKL